MGGFSYNIIEKLIDNTYNTAIETGTFKGDGTQILSKIFKKVYTIEINDVLYNTAVNKFSNTKNIKCLKGDSKRVLLELSSQPELKNENILFWLDAHWSGDSSVNWDISSWKGYDTDTGYVGKKINGIVPGINQVPLEQEIYQIYKNFKGECIIYIDDFDKIDPITLKGLKNKCFDGEDYSHLDFNKIFNNVNDRILYVKHLGNQCVLKFKKIF